MIATVFRKALALAALVLSFGGDALAQTTVWSPTDKAASVAVFGNQASGPLSGGPVFGSVRGTTSQTLGYFEVKLVSASAGASAVVGVADAAMALTGYPGQSPNSAGVQWINTGTMQPFVSGVALVNGFTHVSTSATGDVFMIYFNAGNVWFGRNGVWTSGNPLLGTAPNVTGFAGAVFPAVGTYDAVDIVELNTGGPFKYAPPGPAWDASPAPTFLTVSGSGLHVSLKPARPYIGDVAFVNTANNVGPPAGVFNMLDLSLIDSLAVNAKVAWISGIETITSGSTPEIEDLGIIFRAPGDTLTLCTVPFFATQAAFTVNPGPVVGGIRQSAGVRVPGFVGGKIEWCWFRSTTAAYPASAAYGINFWLDQWAK